MTGRSSHTRTKAGKKEELAQTEMRTANYLRNPAKAAEDLRPTMIKTAQKIIDEYSSANQSNASASTQQSEERTEPQAYNSNQPERQPKSQSDIPINNYVDQAIVLDNPWASDPEYILKCWSGDGHPVKAWNSLWRDPELFDPKGDTLVHLAHSGPQKLLPSFRVDSQDLSSVDYFEFLLSQSRLDSIVTKNNRRSQLWTFENSPDKAPPGAISGDIGDSEFAKIPGADERIRHVLYLEGPGDVPTWSIWNYNLSVRNIIAMVCRKSLVGFSLRSAAEGIMMRFKQWAGTEPMHKLIEWFSAINLHNVKNDPDTACDLLLWSELPEVRWLEAWKECFIHCVGMYNRAIETKAFDRLSPRTTVLLKNAHYDVSKRIQGASNRLQRFDFKDCWVSPENTFAPQPSRLCFENLATFVINFYEKEYGQWPREKQEGEEFWLNRSLIHNMKLDFGAIWRYLIDQEASWIGPDGRSGDKIFYRGKPHFSANTPDLAFTKIIIQIDNAHGPLHNPFPYPKLPVYHPRSVTPAPLAAPVVSKKMGGKALRKIHLVVFNKKEKASKGTTKEEEPTEVVQIQDSAEASISYSNASNITDMPSDFRNRLLKAFIAYEASLDPAEFSPYFARRGHWLLIYGVCQVLSTISVDCPGVQFTQGVTYPLCNQMTDVRGSGEIFEPWPNSGIYLGKGNFQDQSFCWVLAGKLSEGNASSEPKERQNNVPSRSTASSQSQTGYEYHENRNNSGRGGTPHGYADPRLENLRHGPESSHSNRGNPPSQPAQRLADTPYGSSYPSRDENSYTQSNSSRVNLAPPRFPNDKSRANSPYAGDYPSHAEHIYAQSNSSRANLPVPSRFLDNESRTNSPSFGSHRSPVESSWGAAQTTSSRVEFLHPRSYHDNQSRTNSLNVGGSPGHTETPWGSSQSGWGQADHPESPHVGSSTTANPHPSVASRPPLGFERIPAARAPTQFRSDLTAQFNSGQVNIEEFNDLPPPTFPASRADSPGTVDRKNRRKLVSYHADRDANPEFDFSSNSVDRSRADPPSRTNVTSGRNDSFFVANQSGADVPSRAESSNSNADSIQSFQTQGYVADSLRGHTDVRQAIPMREDDWDSDSDDDIVDTRAQSYTRSAAQSQVSNRDDQIPHGSQHTREENVFVKPVHPADNNRLQRQTAGSTESSSTVPSLPKVSSVRPPEDGPFWDKDHVSPLRIKKVVPVYTENDEPPPSPPATSNLGGPVQRMQPPPMESRPESRGASDLSGAPASASASSSYSDRYNQGDPVQRMQQPRRMESQAELRGDSGASGSGFVSSSYHDRSYQGHPVQRTQQQPRRMESHIELRGDAKTSLRGQFDQGGPVQYMQQSRPMESYSAPGDIPAGSASRHPPSSSAAGPSISGAAASYSDKEDENDDTITEESFRAMESRIMERRQRIRPGQIFSDDVEEMFDEVDTPVPSPASTS